MRFGGGKILHAACVWFLFGLFGFFGKVELELLKTE